MKYKLSELCKELSVSAATGRNWLKQGKLVPDLPDGPTPFFSEEYAAALKSALSDGENTALKNRRNKKYVSGRLFYKDYVPERSGAPAAVRSVLLSAESARIDLSATAVNCLLAECAAQLFGRRFRGKPIHLADLWDENALPGICLTLISDLVSESEAKAFISRNPGLFRTDYPYEENADTLGLLYISLNDLRNRKAKGAYYTPTKVVQKLIRNLSDIPLSGKDVLDPCCGTGNFLLQLPPDAAIENVYGSDVDETGIRITRINMALKFAPSDVGVLYKNFTVRDYLLEDSDKQYDVVIGNPPWGYDFSEQEKKRLKEKYQTAGGKNVESYDVFVEQALNELRPGGTLSFVLPEAVLTVKAHSALRSLFLRKTSVRSLEVLGSAFAGVQCPCVILQAGNTPEKAGIRGMAVNDGKREYRILQPRDVTPESFDVLSTDEEYAILHKLESLGNKALLRDHSLFALGIVTGDNRKYVTDKKEEGCELILKGSDIRKFRFKVPERYIRFRPELFQQTAPVSCYRAKEKLLYRFICSQPVFAYDDGQTLSLNSCNLLIPTFDSLRIKYVMSVLNSGISRFYFRKKFHSVKVLRSHIEQIPIPAVSPEEQDRIIVLAEELMKEGTDKKTVRDLYDEIDSVLSEFYGLSREELDYIRSQNGDDPYLP